MSKNDEKKLKCCEKCQVFWTCETKWYRGERNEENICCDTCNYYVECVKEKAPQKS